MGSQPVAGFTSGGGFSTYTPRPSYQDSAVEGYLKSGVVLPPSSYFNSSNRGYPDVAALGNGFAVYLNSYGGWTTVGGTSASSPTLSVVTTSALSLVASPLVKVMNAQPAGIQSLVLALLCLPRCFNMWKPSLMPRPV